MDGGGVEDGAGVGVEVDGGGVDDGGATLSVDEVVDVVDDDVDDVDGVEVSDICLSICVTVTAEVCGAARLSALVA